MKLVYFLLIATLLSTVTGEFAKYPFGSSAISIGLTDLLVTITVFFMFVWQLGIKKKFKISKSLAFIIIFWTTAFLSLLLSGNLRGGLYLIRFIFYSLSFFVCFSLVKEKLINLMDIFNIISISGLIITTLGFLQLLVYPDLQNLTTFGFDPHKNRLVSTFLDPNFVGAFLNISFLCTLCLYLKEKKFCWVVILVILLIGILLTYSRSAYLMLFVELLIFFFFNNKKILILLFAVPLLLYIMLPRFAQRIEGLIILDKSAQERLESWQDGFRVFKHNPIFGVGFNNLRYAYESENLFKVFTPDGGNSGAGVDSSVIFVASTTGIVGLIAYLGWWIYFFFKLITDYLKTKKVESLILVSTLFALFIDSQFINNLFYPPLMLLIYTAAGVYEGSSQN